MKKLHFFLLLIFPLFSQADLSQRVFVKLEFLMEDSSKLTVYNDLLPSQFHEDSIIKTSYWKNTLFWKTQFFHDWLLFRHKIPGFEAQKYPIVQMKLGNYVDINKVLAIKLLHQMVGTLAFNIENNVSAQDSIWFRNEPLRIEQFNGYRCQFYIYIYKEDLDITRALLQISELAQPANFNVEQQMLAILQSQQKKKWVVISYCVD